MYATCTTLEHDVYNIRIHSQTWLYTLGDTCLVTECEGAVDYHQPLQQYTYHHHFVCKRLISIYTVHRTYCSVLSLKWLKLATQAHSLSHGLSTPFALYFGGIKESILPLYSVPREFGLTNRSRSHRVYWKISKRYRASFTCVTKRCSNDHI